MRLDDYHLHQFETACGTFGRPDGEDSGWGAEEAGDEATVALALVGITGWL